MAPNLAVLSGEAMETLMPSSPSAANVATYTFAIQSNYDSIAAKPDAAVRGGLLPTAIQHVSDLDFLKPTSPLLHVSKALFSAGQFYLGSTPSGMVAARDRAAVTIYGDSGGYQFIKGSARWDREQTLPWLLNWYEKHCDIGMTCDIPTEALNYPDRSGYRTLHDCLEPTLFGLAYFERQRSDSNVKLLNVLQGRTQQEADDWYQAVKPFRFDGWAFAGKLRIDLFAVCNRILNLIDDQLIGEHMPFIHVLGTSKLEVAVLLTTLQGVLSEHLQTPITITYDSSTPSKLAGNYQGYSAASFTPTAFNIRSAGFPVSMAYIGNHARFPFQSTVGSKLLLSDLCMSGGHIKQSAWDALSLALVTNHNLDMLTSAIDTANSLLDLRERDMEQFMPTWLVQAISAIRGLFRYSDSRVHLRRHKAVLQRCG